MRSLNVCYKYLSICIVTIMHKAVLLSTLQNLFQLMPAASKCMPWLISTPSSHSILCYKYKYKYKYKWKYKDKYKYRTELQWLQIWIRSQTTYHTHNYSYSRTFHFHDLRIYTWYKDIDVFTKSRIMCFTISPMSIVLWCGWCKSPLLPIFFAHFSYFRGLFMYGHITDWVIGGYVGPSVWSYWCFYISAQHSGLLCVPTPDPLNTSQHNTLANNTSGKAW